MSTPVVIERTNTILYCTSWKRTVEFYGDTLGFDVTHENDWFVEFALGDGSHLSIANADRATIGATGGSGITLSWQVPDIDGHATMSHDLSHASYRKMIQNLIWAAGYNIATIPLAAGVLAPIGFVLPPAVGAALMSLSTIVVAANAQLLRRLDLSPDAQLTQVTCNSDLELTTLARGSGHACYSPCLLGHPVPMRANAETW